MMKRNREEDCEGRQADRSREGGVYVSVADQAIAAYADDAVTRPGDRLSRSQTDDWLIERSGEEILAPSKAGARATPLALPPLVLTGSIDRHSRARRTKVSNGCNCG